MMEYKLRQELRLSHDAMISAASTLAVASNVEGDGPCCNDDEFTARECATWIEGKTRKIANIVVMAVNEVYETRLEAL